MITIKKMALVVFYTLLWPITTACALSNQLPWKEGKVGLTEVTIGEQPSFVAKCCFSTTSGSTLPQENHTQLIDKENGRTFLASLTILSQNSNLKNILLSQSSGVTGRSLSTLCEDDLKDRVKDPQDNHPEIILYRLLQKHWQCKKVGKHRATK